MQGKVIDADGHILEPVDLWQSHLEAKYKDQAIRMTKGEDGVEYLIVEDKPLPMTRGIGPTAAGIGQSFEEIFVPGKFGYADGPKGAYDAQARLQLMDKDGIDISVLFPTLGLIWEPGVKNAELAAAYCRAYNNWIVDFCSAVFSLIGLPLSVAGAGLCFVLWKLLGSTQSFETAFRCVAYVNVLGPFAALAEHVFLGWLGVVVWGLFLLVTASVEVHQLKARDAWLVFGAFGLVWVVSVLHRSLG